MRRVAIAAAALLLGLSPCGDEDRLDTAAHARAQDFRFAPATVRVAAGGTVTWRNSGRTFHNVKGHGFFSRAVPVGESWSHRFTKPGTYAYVCTLHPAAMRGRVVVSR
jgi:plastocyanin